MRFDTLRILLSLDRLQHSCYSDLEEYGKSDINDFCTSRTTASKPFRVRGALSLPSFQQLLTNSTILTVIADFD